MQGFVKDLKFGGGGGGGTPKFGRRAPLGGAGGTPPRKLLKNRYSEIDSEAFWRYFAIGILKFYSNYKLCITLDTWLQKFLGGNSFRGRGGYPRSSPPLMFFNWNTDDGNLS